MHDYALLCLEREFVAGYSIVIEFRGVFKEGPSFAG
jgi:hypothetical protein